MRGPRGVTRSLAAAGVVAWLALGAGCAPAAPNGSAVAETPPPATAAASSDSADYPRWETMEPGDQLAYNRRLNLAQRGREVYDKYCVGCHGEYGRGDGPAAERLITQPRDLTSGIYKFRSTDSGSLPLEADIYRVITRGLSGVSMPAFPLMPHRDKLAVIEYIKTFYPDWDAEAASRRRVPVPLAPDDLDDPARLLRGRVVYLAMQCTQCHGVDGAGTGATRTEYVDAWGNPQKAFNFTRGSLKSGNAPEDIYRTFHTGLRSIMPSYGAGTLASVVSGGFPPAEGLLADGELERLAAALADFPASVEELSGMTHQERGALEQRNSWDLVAYIRSLRSSRTTAAAVLGEGYE